MNSIDSTRVFTPWLCCSAAGYGPVDQGAINQFYENTVIGAKLGQEFNAKPYFSVLEASYIVHFHGPKPADYLAYLETGDCTFGNMCQTGLKHSLCYYALEWARYVEDEDVGQRLESACSTLSRDNASNDTLHNKPLTIKNMDGRDLPVVLAKLE